MSTSYYPESWASASSTLDPAGFQSQHLLQPLSMSSQAGKEGRASIYFILCPCTPKAETKVEPAQLASFFHTPTFWLPLYTWETLMCGAQGGGLQAWQFGFVRGSRPEGWILNCCLLVCGADWDTDQCAHSLGRLQGGRHCR